MARAQLKDRNIRACISNFARCVCVVFSTRQKKNLGKATEGLYFVLRKMALEFGPQRIEFMLNEAKRE